MSAGTCKIPLMACFSLEVFSPERDIGQRSLGCANITVGLTELAYTAKKKLRRKLAKSRSPMDRESHQNEISVYGCTWPLLVVQCGGGTTRQSHATLGCIYQCLLAPHRRKDALHWSRWPPSLGNTHAPDGIRRRMHQIKSLVPIRPMLDTGWKGGNEGWKVPHTKALVHDIRGLLQQQR